MPCSHDTNGDGNCGRPACPECGPEHLLPLIEPPEAGCGGFEVIAAAAGPDLGP